MVARIGVAFNLLYGFRTCETSGREPVTRGQHRLLHASPPLRAKRPRPQRGAPDKSPGPCARGAAEGPSLRFLSWLAGVPMQGAPPLRCGVRREGGLRAGGGSKGHPDSRLQPLWRLRRSHMVPNLITSAGGDSSSHCRIVPASSRPACRSRGSQRSTYRRVRVQLREVLRV